MLISAAYSVSGIRSYFSDLSELVRTGENA